MLDKTVADVPAAADLTPSLTKMCFMCVLTVCTDTGRRSALARLVRPSTTSGIRFRPGSVRHSHPRRTSRGVRYHAAAHAELPKTPSDPLVIAHGS